MLYKRLIVQTIKNFEKTFKRRIDIDDTYGIIKLVPPETQMFGKKKMTIKYRQEIVINQLFQACYDEWCDDLSDDLIEIIVEIVSHKQQKTMEDIFGERFLKLAHLFINARKLLTEIEELDNTVNQ